jgi:transposase
MKINYPVFPAIRKIRYQPVTGRSWHPFTNATVNYSFRMDALHAFAKRARYNDYHKNPGAIEPIFTLFLTAPDTTYAMREVSERTKIPISTLYSWREKIRTDPEWRPSKEHFSSNPRLFPPDVETMLADFIRYHFVSEGRALTRPTLQPLLLLLVQDLVVEGVLEPRALDFKSSYHFMSNFLRRVGLSFRRARAQRRPVLDEEECAHFMANLIAAHHRYPPSSIVNFDESNWHLVMADDQTVATRGAETVCHYCNGDPKANFSFFATITADGSKLPLILIAKGTTNRCHKQFGKHDAYIHDVWHSPSGWSTVTLMIEYLNWLRRQIPGEPLCLIMDQYTTHTAAETEREAENLGIEVIWVPRGGTGRYQPLDRRIFGALKSKGKAKWRRYFNDHYGAGCTKEMGAQLLLESWNDLSESVVTAGWDYGEPAGDDDDDESDDSDDDFELRMCTDSSDEDVQELQDSPTSNEEDE